MIRYSVLIPQRNAGNELARQLPELRRVLDLLALPYEVIAIDQASGNPTRTILSQLLERHACLRVLALDRAAGPEAALAAGIAVARGEIVVAIGPGAEFPLERIPHLIAELSQRDIVFARQARVGWAHAWNQIAGWPQRWLLGVPARGGDGRFWAARREAVAGLESTRGTARFLPWLAAQRGFRVGETKIRFQPAGQRQAWPHPADLLAVWWLNRRHRPFKVEELRASSELAAPIVGGVNHWIDAAQHVGRREIDLHQRDSA